MKMVRLSAPRTGRIYSQEMFLVLIFTRGWVDPRAMVRSDWNVTDKSSGTIGNRSQDRPTSSALTTTPPQAPKKSGLVAQVNCRNRRYGFKLSKWVFVSVTILHPTRWRHRRLFCIKINVGSIKSRLVPVRNFIIIIYWAIILFL